MATATEQKYLTVEQVATLVGVTHKPVRRRIALGELPAVQLGGKGTAIRVPREALNRWLWWTPKLGERREPS